MCMMPFLVPQRSGEEIGSPEISILGSYEEPCRCWELNLEPL